MVDGSRLDMKLIAQPYTSESAELTDVLDQTATTAQLADATHRVNTTDKYAGRQCYETTLKLLYVADGPAAVDDWTLIDGLGATQVTPS